MGVGETGEKERVGGRGAGRERERFQSSSQEVFLMIRGAEGNNPNIIKKRKEGTAEIKAPRQ